jgi:hypothetical protein
LEGEAWSRYFRDFRHSAFRLELHPAYTMPGEADELRRFQGGEKPPPGYHYGWLDTMTAARAAGKTVRRVRVVCQPLSDYIRYEFEWGFTYNVEAGEDIRVLDLTDQPDPGLPDHDFWLFDDQIVVQMLYRPDGTQIGRELLADPDLDTYLGYQNKAWCGSVPFGDYLAGLAPRV